MSAFYNENDPKAAAWLRELIAQGHIAPGIVDERSISDIKPEDLDGFTQCHFFAGIGGWSLALRLAGWPDSRPVWTGSCPCQPFSCAGKREGEADNRHLWPVFRELMRACKPSVTFGEQVASADGREWLAGVLADLEAMGHQRAAADLCAAGIAAPHIRQRLWWVAYADGGRFQQCDAHQRPVSITDASSVAGRLAESAGGNAGAERQQRGGEQRQQQEDGGARGLAESKHAERRSLDVTGQDEQHGHDTGREEAHGQSGACGEVLRLEHAAGNGREQRRAESRGGSSASGCSPSGMGDADEQGCSGQSLGLMGSSSEGHWSAYDLIECTDGKSRRIEPGSFPLAHGVSHRVGLLRGYGNAIVPEVAQVFIESFLEAAA